VKAANRLLQVAAEGVKLMAASHATVICDKCAAKRRINTLDAWNGRTRCYKCEPKLRGEVGQTTAAGAA
jgi:hypothetical protein